MICQRSSLLCLLRAARGEVGGVASCVTSLPVCPLTSSLLTHLDTHRHTDTNTRTHTQVNIEREAVCSLKAQQPPSGLHWCRHDGSSELQQAFRPQRSSGKTTSGGNPCFRCGSDQVVVVTLLFKQMKPVFLFHSDRVELC